MLDQHIRCLIALGETRDVGTAARRCGVKPQELREMLRTAEHEFGCPLINYGTTFTGFTNEGEKVLAWAKEHMQDRDDLRAMLRGRQQEAAIAPLLERRSVSPKRLCNPGPSAEEMDLILQAALRAPDHGGLLPWRVIEFGHAERATVATLFEAEKMRRDPLASDSDRRRAREHATRPPSLLAFVVSPKPRRKIPVREQWLAAGAALCNLLNASHQLGFGAIVLSGERCFDSTLTGALGIGAEESLAGFVTIGRVTEMPPHARHTMPVEIWSRWRPANSEPSIPNLAASTAGNALDFE